MKKKLIEVALPLEEINEASSKEKSNPFLKGHPRNLHQWWARRPLAASRAVLFASLVDDPSSHPNLYPTERDQFVERARLHNLIRDIVRWENTANRNLFVTARQEILASSSGSPPPVLDPFCGGGSIPLEAQRLGLEAHASDLNPVAVLITRALLELPGHFEGHPSINPETRQKITVKWEGVAGLQQDIRYYAQWIQERAEERIGNTYPDISLSSQLGGGTAHPLAWLWSRVVKCPNPACGCEMPLVKTFLLSGKSGKRTWLQPEVDPATRTITFSIRSGAGAPPEASVNRRGAKCLACGTLVPLDYIRKEGRSGRIRIRLMALVADGGRGRIYPPASQYQETIALAAVPPWVPDSDLPDKALGFRIQAYGMTHHRDLFTSRQLLALSTMSSLVTEAAEQIVRDGGTKEYANAIATYLACAVDKQADYNNSLCTWNPTNENISHLFTKQTVSMAWDFVESNPLRGGLSIAALASGIADAVGSASCGAPGKTYQADATSFLPGPNPAVICTDPPYYDNMGYADLSDFFFVWLRHSIGIVHPDLFSTLLVPKMQELVAAPDRFDGNSAKAQEFFEQGFSKAFGRMRKNQHPEYPMTVFYAFKQTEVGESEEDAQNPVASTGWETMLQGLIGTGWQITGTWPIRTERGARTRSIGSNALASSIVLVCRPRPDSAPITTRKEFLGGLKVELPCAIREMRLGNVAPVDLAQAAIGPGMAVFSRYNRVLESDGSTMAVRTALALINQALDEVLSEQEGDFDPDTRWALAWFEQHGFEEGLYGEAEVLATAKALSVSALDETRILHSRGGKVRLLRRDELSPDWNPSAERRLTVWAVTQHLIWALDKNGETGAAELASKVGGLAETARDLAYRLYIVSERNGWAAEAGYYNSLVVSWPAIAPKTFVLS